MLPSLSPISSAQSTPASNVTPVSSRGPSLSTDSVHMRTNARPSLVFQETRNSFNRTSVENDKELAKINAKLDLLSSQYELMMKKLDYLIQLSEANRK